MIATTVAMITYGTLGNNNDSFWLDAAAHYDV